MWRHPEIGLDALDTPSDSRSPTRRFCCGHRLGRFKALGVGGHGPTIDVVSAGPASYFRARPMPTSGVAMASISRHHLILGHVTWTSRLGHTYRRRPVLDLTDLPEPMPTTTSDEDERAAASVHRGLAQQHMYATRTTTTAGTPTRTPTASAGVTRRRPSAILTLRATGGLRAQGRQCQDGPWHRRVS